MRRTSFLRHAFGLELHLLLWTSEAVDQSEKIVVAVMGSVVLHIIVTVVAAVALENNVMAVGVVLLEIIVTIVAGGAGKLRNGCGCRGSDDCGWPGAGNRGIGCVRSKQRYQGARTNLSGLSQMSLFRVCFGFLLVCFGFVSACFGLFWFCFGFVSI